MWLDFGRPALTPKSGISELLLLSWGPQHVAAEEFADLPGADLVMIFGSWAARYHQQAGPPPPDLDVLVIGTPAREAVYDAADQAERRPGMPVNPVVRTAAAWRGQADPSRLHRDRRPV